MVTLIFWVLMAALQLLYGINALQDNTKPLLIASSFTFFGVNLCCALAAGERAIRDLVSYRKARRARKYSESLC